MHCQMCIVSPPATPNVRRPAAVGSPQKPVVTTLFVQTLGESRGSNNPQIRSGRRTRRWGESLQGFSVAVAAGKKLHPRIVYRHEPKSGSRRTSGTAPIVGGGTARAMRYLPGSRRYPIRAQACLGPGVVPPAAPAAGTGSIAAASSEPVLATVPAGTQRARGCPPRGAATVPTHRHP